MSERMIELQKAKLLGQAAAAKGVNKNSSNNDSNSNLTPQQMAAAAMYQEESKLKIFLQKLAQTRGDDSAVGGAPTVPAALCRRLLQKQGVGYLDDTVAAVTAAAADRFLATILQQGATCRKRRCDGMMSGKEERRKHVSLYRADADDRKRRKFALEQKRTQGWLEAVQAAKDIIEKDGTTGKPTKKKKRPSLPANPAADGGTNANGKKNDNNIDALEEDSLDDEEEYYNDYYGELSSDDEDDESNFMLLLRDLKHPLEAWGYKLTGKVGLGAIPLETAKPKNDDDDNGNANGGEDNNNAAMDDTNEEDDEKVAAENGDVPMSKSPKPPDDGADSKVPSRAATPMMMNSSSPSKVSK
mmetsp:Transcript_10325/g.15857  ORF Transcript_10325/g.15857 Transcript_10325/m.15857 type:complete len:357 (+) Transcript_10325:456-1526(+)